MGAANGLAGLIALVLVVVCGLVVSAVLTWGALIYARRHGLLDLPGRRRSHTLPTPRGGGVGLVSATLLVGLPAWALRAAAPRWLPVVPLAVALLAVALVGWRDDHAPLPVLPRLIVHGLAAVLVAIMVLAPWAAKWPSAGWQVIPLAIVLVGFVNAHNFMDGIDGLLGQQGLLVMLGYGLIATQVRAPGLAALAFATAAGCLGFLFFNAPPARIFMGDVGSGTLGLVIGATAALLVRHSPGLLWACLIVPSAFLVDSGLTLARRVVGGQRWYAPHRQHLYQWLVRLKWSHVRTDVAYLTWNLVVVAPLAWVAVRWPRTGLACCSIVYAASGLMWFAGKRACIAAAQRGRLHETA